MTASELIDDLRQLIQERGDLDCVNGEGELVSIEFNDDDGEVFVIE